MQFFGALPATCDVCDVCEQALSLGGVGLTGIGYLQVYPVVIQLLFIHTSSAECSHTYE